VIGHRGTLAEEVENVVVMPAIVVGLFVVFAVVGLPMYVVLHTIAEWRTRAGSRLWGYFTDTVIGVIAVVAGVIAVVLIVLAMVNTPEWKPAIWIGLTVVGIVVGLLSVLFGALSSLGRTTTRYRPPTSAGMPPASTRVPPASTRVPPAPEEGYRPPASARVVPPVREDPYRTLLNKAMYDKGLADRLIEDERKRTPYASLDELIRSAIDRLERGNR